MKLYGVRATSLLALLLAGAIPVFGQRDYHDQSLDLIRYLVMGPWAGRGRSDRYPRAETLEYKSDWAPSPTANQMGVEEAIRVASTKRSAVATALNGRRRRQSSLGKAGMPYAGVGILNDLDSFITAFGDNIDSIGSLSSQQRATLFKDPPAIVRAPPSVSGSGGGGGGVGIRRFHALRPLRPTGNIRTYNRRSFVEPESVYPGANHHDPGLLWTGLGR